MQPTPAGADHIVVINDDAVESGGAAAVAIASVRQLRARQVRVTFLTGNSIGAVELAEEGVEVSVLGGTHLLDGSRIKAALRGLYDPATGAALRQWIDANDTPRTVYHLHNWHKVLSPSVFRPLRDVARRLIVTAHDYFLACPNGGYFIYPRGAPCALHPGGLHCVATACDRRHYGHKLWRVARHAVRRQLLDLRRGAATVVTVHDGLARHFVEAGVAAANIRTLRNPVTPWRRERVKAERNRDVFFIGRLDEDKGVDLLARAARRAGVRLHLIGDGPLAAPLARDYPEIEQHGWQSRQSIAALIDSARLVVCPTRCRETFGLVVLEAAMSGVPVIVSRFALIADEIVRHGFGAACDPYDEAALASTIARFGSDDAEIEALSRRAFAQAGMLAPTPAQWCDALLDLYADRVICAGAARSTGISEFAVTARLQRGEAR